MRVVSGDIDRGVSVDQFSQSNYAEIKRWAMEMTGRDHGTFEDIVHDAYLKFLRTGRESVVAENTDKYVHVRIRNSYNTFLRKNWSDTEVRIDLFELSELTELVSQSAQYRGAEAAGTLFAVCEFAS